MVIYSLGLLNGILHVLIAAKDEFGTLCRGKLVLNFFCSLGLGLCCLGGHFIALCLGFELGLCLRLRKCRRFSARLFKSLSLGSFGCLAGLLFLSCLLLSLYAGLFRSLCGSRSRLPAC